jgi:SPP1 gp7 family putative phage head morphogenesis protein
MRLVATLTGNSRERERSIQQLYLDRLQFKHQRRIAREIARAMNDAAVAISKGEPIPEAATHENRMKRIMDVVWTDSARQFAEHIAGAAKHSQSPSTLKRSPVNPTQVMDGAIREWIQLYGGLKITQITETTLDEIRTILNAGIAAGLGSREIAKAVRDVAPTKSAVRAGAIARTETHAAANASAQATAELAGVSTSREWVASGGSRTRPSHAEADGQIVGMNEPFIVGGSPLMYPGDPSGPANLVINCRCAVVFVVE